MHSLLSIDSICWGKAHGNYAGNLTLCEISLPFPFKKKKKQNLLLHRLAAALIRGFRSYQKESFLLFLPVSVSACHLCCTCKENRSASTFKCSYWMCKHLSGILYVEQTSLSGLNVLSYKYDRLRPERLLICPYTVYIWARWKWEYTEDCEKSPGVLECFIPSLDICQYFMRRRAAVCWIHISISALCFVCTNSQHASFQNSGAL